MRIASLMGNSMGEQLTYDRRQKDDGSDSDD
jgi:hypothetical protein